MLRNEFRWLFSSPQFKATPIPQSFQKMDGMATFPISISEAKIWIVNVQKRSGEKTFFMSIEDPTLLIGGTNDIPPRMALIFSANFDGANGKPKTVLKTDQYTFEVTISVE